SSVMEMEPTAGTLSRASALPQYLINAKFARARALARPTLSEIAITLEPIDRVADRLPRLAPSVAELALGFAAREIHVLRRHAHGVERGARLAARDPREALAHDRHGIHGPVRQP